MAICDTKYIQCELVIKKSKVKFQRCLCGCHGQRTRDGRDPSLPLPGASGKSDVCPFSLDYVMKVCSCLHDLQDIISTAPSGIVIQVTATHSPSNVMPVQHCLQRMTEHLMHFRTRTMHYCKKASEKLLHCLSTLQTHNKDCLSTLQILNYIPCLHYKHGTILMVYISK